MRRCRRGRQGARMAVAVAVLGATLVLVAASPAAARAVPWTGAVVATVGTATDVAAADIDGDGDLDLVSASVGTGTVAWHRNDGGGTWGATTTVTVTAGGASVAVVAADIDGDGDLDVASASSDDDTIAWYENDGTPGGPTWTKTDVSTSADAAADVVAADIDGDGDLDLASASFTDNTIAWYANTAASGDGSTWARTPVSTIALSARSVIAADIDGDGDVDLASASHSDDTIAWYQNTAASGDGSTWARTAVSTGANGARDVTAADIDGDGDTDLASASDFDSAIAWYQNDGTPGGADWAETTAGSASSARAVTAADIDGDGDVDLASAHSGTDAITWYENHGDGTWATATVATNPVFAAVNAAVVAADLDGDGDLDLAAALTFDSTISWYRNDTIHRSASAWTAADTATTAVEATSVAAGDLDGDGDLDLASSDDDTIAWYENTAPNGNGSTWTATDVAAVADASSVAIGDINGDGHLDLVSASQDDDTIAWYANDGAANPTFAAPVTVATSASSPQAVAVGDLDGDGDLDLASASFADDTIAWYENTAASGNGSTWTGTDIDAAADGALSVVLADVDGDGHLDLVAPASESHDVFWYRNDRNANPTFARTTIDSAIDATSVAAADLDGDGDIDVAAAEDDTIAWYENTAANGDGSTWTGTDITTTAAGAWDVTAGDIDGDGDLDLASASQNDDTIAWYQNDGGADPAFGATDIATSAAGAQAVAVGDIDGDGDLDLASASFDDDTVAWYRNDGGQVALATASTGPSTLASNTADDLLAVTVTHRGRAGDHDAELTGVALRLDDGTTALTQAQAEAIVEELRVYRDDGNATFDGGDALLTTATALPVDGSGDLTVTIPDVAGGVVAPGATARFFVVVDLAADAYLATPHTLRVTHRPSASTAEDDAFTVALTKAAASDVSATTLTATNTAPTVGAPSAGPATTSTTTTTVPSPTTTVPPSASPPPVVPATGGGGWFVGPDGPIAVAAPRGTPPGSTVIAVSPTDAIAITPDGRVLSTNPAYLFGSARGMNAPVVGAAIAWVRKSGEWVPGGYWLVGADGGVFTFGSARFHGSLGSRKLNQPVVGVAATPSGNGYWLVAKDGGVFTFGDARFRGSTGARRLAAPIVGLAPTPSGNGYWLVARDGGVFTFGDAPFHGSGAARRQVFDAFVPAPDGTYWLVQRDGATVRFNPRT